MSVNLSAEKFRRSTVEQKLSGSNFTSVGKDEQKSVVEDETDSADIILHKSSICASSFVFQGVRFSPRVIEFIDAFEGKQFATKITIQNVGKEPVMVKVGEPMSFIFQLKRPIRRAKFLASGCTITRYVTYSYHNDDIVQKSQIPIQINNKLIDYPIVVKRALPEIEVQPSELNFEMVNLGASAKTLLLTICNYGGKRTKFEIDLGKNDLDLVVSPARGTVTAKNQVNISIEMMGLLEGKYYKELWVTTSEMSIRVPIRVEVLRPRLEIIHPNVTEDFTLIDFKPAFKGTQRADSFFLQNYSAETTLFIVLADINGNLQFLNEARKIHETFNMFMMTAEEGRLEPFESRMLTVLFRPKATVIKKGWHCKEGEKKKKACWEHLVFFRVNRVHCIERKELVKVEAKPVLNIVREKSKVTMQSTISFTNFSMGMRRIYPDTNIFYDGVAPKNFESRLSIATRSDENILRLCLHGTAVDPDIVPLPTCLEFEELLMGETKKKVLKLTNDTIVAVKYKFHKTTNIEVEPNEGWLQPRKAFEFLVTLRPSRIGTFKTNLKIEIFGQSDVVFETDKEIVSIAEVYVPVRYSVNLITENPKPKVILGITPVMISSVGFRNDMITYGSNIPKPYAAMLCSLMENFKPKWMVNEPDKEGKVNNAVIAFPNDRPAGLYTWPKLEVCRTIFKGLFRYSPPPDTTYTYTPEEKTKIQKHKAYWNDYLRTLEKTRKSNSCGTSPSKEDLPCSLYKLGGKGLSEQGTLKLKDLIGKNKKEHLPRHALVPLSPLFLSNVNVEPKLINFGTVAINTLVHEKLTLHNLNPFAISIRFVPGKSAVTVRDSGTITVQPLFTKSLWVSFQTKDLGRYYGFLNYVINGSHEFKITISAFVTTKTLVLEDKTLIVEFGNYPERNAFQPRSTFLELGNLLKSSIKYRWEKPIDSPFVTDIVEGEVPPSTQILTEFKFALSPDKPFYSEVNLISESGDSELIKLIHPMKKVAVNFVTNKVDMKDVPLNLLTKIAPLIENGCYHDVIFQVTNWNPMPGVIVEPKNGVLRPRSLSPINISVQIPVIMRFTFEVIVQVHMLTKISLKVTGNVVLPKIRISPTEVWMRKICPQSFDIVQLCIENAGTTPTDLEIDFKAWPEFSVQNDFKHIYLQPSKIAKVLIHFHPKEIARYVFYLPLTINKILGPPIFQEPETEYVSFYIFQHEMNYHDFGNVVSTKTFNFKIPCICFNSNVSASMLTITPQNVVFNLEQDSKKKFAPQTVIFENSFIEKEVTFCIRSDDLGENRSSFDLIPEKKDEVEYRTKAMKAILKKGEQLVMKAFFRPKKPGIHNIDIPVFVKGYFKDTVYAYINLQGELKQPTLLIDHDEIYFPPLPLNIGSETVLTIGAENYTSPNAISWAVFDPHDGGEILSDFVTVKWKDEPTIKPDLGFQKFRVEITFKSSIPISLRNYVVFIDTNGNYCTVLIRGVADNSLATIHSFIATRASLYKLVRDSPPIFPTILEDDINQYCPVRSNNDGKIHSKGFKKGISICSFPSEGFINEGIQHPEKVCQAAIDKGPTLVIQMTKSMTKPTQLNFVKVSRNSVFYKRNAAHVFDQDINKNRMNSSTYRPSDSLIKRRTLSVGVDSKPNTSPSGHSIEDIGLKKHIENTIKFVERWMFEVIMQCEQYFMIPYSFQKLKNVEKISKKSRNPSLKESKEKDIFDFLEKIINFNEFSLRPSSEENEKSYNTYAVFSELLRYLQNHGCQVGSIKPEHLLNYENYLAFVEGRSSVDTFRWRNVEPYKIFSLKILKDQGVSSTKVNTERLGNLSSSSLLYSRQSWRKSFFEGQRIDSEVTVHDELVEEEKNEEVERVKMQIESTRQLIEGKQFSHKSELLTEEELKLRSTQAWLDIIIQVFRALILPRVFYKNTIPDLITVKMGSRVFVESVELKNHRDLNYSASFYSHTESLICNTFSVQERILLMWLNYHFAIQREVLWKLVQGSELFPGRVINNFDRDLSDSLVFIAVTVAHCPYIIDEYFSDIFLKADTQNKLYHNAGKITLAWRTLNLGLTVESTDIVNPHPLFMLMLVVQLYEVLPTLRPKYLISFTAPLSSEVKRIIQIKNDTDEVIYYEPKFIEEHEGLFCLHNFPSMIELRPHRTTDIQIIFYARKIKRITATLILFGSVISPNFAKHLTFYLEGEPSELTEIRKFSFTAPLYKVVCVNIPVTPPYFEPTTYEIWYTTNKPFYKEYIDVSLFMKPWSKIWNRKVSRRLYLQKHEITITEDSKSSSLGLTVACFTEEDRCFWLMFRSPEVGDFIIPIHIKVTKKAPLATIYLSYPEHQSECSYRDKTSEYRFSGANLCPLQTELAIPARNEPLWESLKYMFLKTLHNQEKSFWAEHFETDIGICLILWLTNDDEESAVVDEFIHLLQTQVTYNLKIQPPNSKYVNIPKQIEIEDVRKKHDIRIPLHISKDAPPDLKLNLTMTSENGREIRNYKIILSPATFKKEKVVEVTASSTKDNCGPCWPLNLKGVPDYASVNNFRNN